MTDDCNQVEKDRDGCKDAARRGARCPTCGGPVTTENFSEATITTGLCGYSWAAHFGGGEVQTKPCVEVSRAR